MASANDRLLIPLFMLACCNVYQALAFLVSDYEMLNGIGQIDHSATGPLVRLTRVVNSLNRENLSLFQPRENYLSKSRASSLNSSSHLLEDPCCSVIGLLVELG